MCNLATQITAFTSADSYNDKDSVKAWHSTFQFISAVCIERLLTPRSPTTERQGTPFFSLNSLFSEIISKSLSRSAGPPGFWCHFHCNTSLMTDICFTWARRQEKKTTHTHTHTGRRKKQKKNIHATHTLFVSDDISDFTLTCFVKTIPEEIKRHITQVKPETQICHNKPNPVWAAACVVVSSECVCFSWSMAWVSGSFRPGVSHRWGDVTAQKHGLWWHW